LSHDEHLEHDEHFDNGDHVEHDEHLERDEAFDSHGPLGAEEPFDEQHPPEREGSAGMLYDDQAEETLERPAQPAASLERGVAEEPDREERSWSYDTTEEWEGDKPAERAPAPTESAEAPPPAEATRPAAPPEPAEHAGQETVEYDVEAEHQRGEKDDPLEETPEFLQDTPDHDRLWFEQRPPRPFDFDK
jgi:hypothetical protein